MATTSTNTFNYLTEYQNNVSGQRNIIGCSSSGASAYNEDGTTYLSPIFNSFGFLMPATSRGYVFFTSGQPGDSKKWDGGNPGTVSAWGFGRPGTPITVATGAAGAITLNIGRQYFTVFQNSVTGQLSDLSPVSASTGAVSSVQINLTNIPVASDPQVNEKFILATADGGDQTTLYFVTQISNPTTSFTDNTAETTLLANNIYQEVAADGSDVGVADNTPPLSAMLLPTKHQGRIFGVVPSSQAAGTSYLLYFSKAYGDLITSTGTLCGRYEECWPATNFLDISEGAEEVIGLLSDGTYLYIGTERHIRRLSGEGPADFSIPDVIFNSVGLIHQNTWRMVMREGTPIGMMWMTPDYRVMLSDGNTYQDVGTPIQTLLNQTKQHILPIFSQGPSPHAMAVSYGPYSLYILFIGVNTANVLDTACVYDLRTQRWFVWTMPPDTSVVNSIFNVNLNGVPQPIVSLNTDVDELAINGALWKFVSTATQDAATPDSGALSNIPVTIQTSWLHMGEPTMRKLLNEIELLTGDPNMLVTVEGAQTEADFSSPLAVVTNAPVVTSPVGTLKVYLAGLVAKYKYYRLTFTSSATNTDVLSGLSVEFFPLNNI